MTIHRFIKKNLIGCFLFFACMTCIHVCNAQENKDSSIDHFISLEEMTNAYFHKEKCNLSNYYSIEGIDLLVFQESLLDKLQKKIAKEIIAELKTQYFLRYPYGKIKQTWFTEDLKYLSDPLATFVGYVSIFKSTIKIDHGNIVDVSFTKRMDGKYENCIIRDGKFIVLHQRDGHWYEDKYYKLDCFADYLNQYDGNYSKDPVAEQQFRLLLFTDSVGISTIHLLEPKKPNATEKELFSNLQKRVAQLEKWSFSYLFTLDDRIMSGRYMEATYSTANGWSLKEIFR